MFNTEIYEHNLIATCTMWCVWQRDMEGWKKLRDEATTKELKTTYDGLLRRSESYFGQHMRQLKAAGEGQVIEVDYAF
jgi:hypothetical protein